MPNLAVLLHFITLPKGENYFQEMIFGFLRASCSLPCWGSLCYLLPSFQPKRRSTRSLPVDWGLLLVQQLQLGRCNGPLYCSLVWCHL